MGDGFGLDAWWDEPAYQAARGPFSTKGRFILRSRENVAIGPTPEPATLVLLGTVLAGIGLRERRRFHLIRRITLSD